jgi:alpha-glucosidase
MFAFIQSYLLTLIFSGILLSTRSLAQSESATTTYSSQFTVPSAVDIGFPILPSVQDPEAPNPQVSCPGYTASNVNTNENGFTAALTLAGEACNVFGTDIEDLSLTVEYQNSGRLNVNIQPSVLVSHDITATSNATSNSVPLSILLVKILHIIENY